MPRPDRTDRGALDRYTHALQQSLAVVTRAIWVADYDPRRQGPHAVRLSENPVRLNRDGREPLYLGASQQFDTERGRLGWRVTTRQYIYTLGSGPEFKDAFVAWHWHPDKREECHLHAYVAHAAMGEMGEWHIPTRRVSFEEVLRFAIVDLRVRPIKNDWAVILEDVEKAFDSHKSWHGGRRPSDRA